MLGRLVEYYETVRTVQRFLELARIFLELSGIFYYFLAFSGIFIHSSIKVQVFRLTFQFISFAEQENSDIC